MHGVRKAISLLFLPSIFSSAFSNLIIYTNSVAVVQTVSLIFNPDWINAIALVVTIIGGFVIGGILTLFHASHVWWKQIIDGYFRDFRSCYFEPTTIEEFEELDQNFESTSDVIRSRLEMAPFLSRFLKPKIRAFYVYPKGQGGILTAALKTYPMGTNISYVFLQPERRPPQMSEDSWKLRKMVVRFTLLHEIGHATTMHRIIAMWAWAAVPNFCLLLVFVALHREVGMLQLFIVLALAIIWVGFFLQQRRNREERVELAADSFALVLLSKRSDFRTIIAHIARTSRKQSKFSRYRARLLVRRAQILSPKGLEFRLSGWQGENWLAEMLLPIPLWLTLLFFAGMLLLGATLRIKDWKELAVLSFLWLVGPASWHYYYMFVRAKLPRTLRARRVALEFLKAHAPPDLPVERQVKSVFDLL